MSSHRTHLVFYLAVACGIIISLNEFLPTYRPTREEWLAFPIGAVYCLLPDIDCASSKARHYAIMALLALSCMMLALGQRYIAAIFAISIPILFLTKHRGFFHTPVAGFVLSAPLLALDTYLFAMALMGYISHLILDRKII
jgi:hypothetical protein